MQTRDEHPEDADAIRQVTDAAFAGLAYSSQTEARIVDALRDAGALALSLVAEREGQIVGHIAFSPVKIDGQLCDWYGLGPVSVRPDLQKQGIGAALIRAGLDRLKDLGAHGCVLLGDPGYYIRFGFECDEALTYPGGPPEYFQRLVLAGPAARGEVSYHPTFDIA